MKKALLILLAFCAVSCVYSKHRPVDHRDAPVTVKVMTIGSTESERTEKYIGELVADRSNVIMAEYPAKLTSIRVRKGSRVSAGDTLAILYSQSLVSARDGSKATYERARDAVERVRKMKGSVSEMQLVEAESKFTQAEASYIAAEDALSSCYVTAPFSGAITEVLAEQGVRVSVSQPLFRLVDLGSIRVAFTVGEGEFSLFPRGSRVSVDVPSVGKSFQASVESVSLEASPMSRTYMCLARPLSSAWSLLPGMVCKVGRGVSSSGIVIPASAVMTGEDGRYVWTVDEEGIVRKRYITVAGYSGTGIEISSGLEAGDVLVISGTGKICGGMSVNTEE